MLENAAAEILEGGERGTPFDERQGIEEDLPKGLTGASAENKTHGATLARDLKSVNDWPGSAPVEARELDGGGRFGPLV